MLVFFVGFVDFCSVLVARLAIENSNQLENAMAANPTIPTIVANLSGIFDDRSPIIG